MGGPPVVGPTIPAAAAPTTASGSSSSPGPSGPAAASSPNPAAPTPASSPASVSPPTIRRGPSSSQWLTLDWHYPVYQPELIEDGRTRVLGAGEALSREEAFAYVTHGDPRPLLVLRECAQCAGTDNALLSRGLDNEKTALMSRWFHCIKLPIGAVEGDHPFRKLFDEEHPEHLYMSTCDGVTRVVLEGETSRTELWKAMLTVLGAEYARDPQRSLRDQAAMLDSLDGLDQQISQLEARLERALENEQAGSAKLRRLQDDLGDARDERDAMLREMATRSHLGLNPERHEQGLGAARHASHAGGADGQAGRAARLR